MKDISTKSNQLVKYLRNKNKKKKKKNESLMKEFESRVQEVLSGMADMTVPVLSKDSKQPESRTQEVLDKNNEDDSHESNGSSDQNPTPGPSSVSNDPVSQENQRENVTVSDIMLDDIERRKRKRQKLLSKEEELRQKLMKKKSALSVSKTTNVSKEFSSERSGTVGKTAGGPFSIFEKSQKTQNLPVSSDSLTSTSSQKSLNSLMNKSPNVPGTVDSEELTPKSSNDENTLSSDNAHVIEKTLEEIRHCNSMNSLKSFMLDQTISVKESLDNFRCRIDPEIPICYFDIYGCCIDQNCNEQHLKDIKMSDQELLKEILSLFPDKKNSSETIEAQAARLLKEKSIDEIVDDLREEAKLVLSN